MKPRQFMPAPRIWSEVQVASRLGKSVSWFLENRQRLEMYSFPKIDPLLKGRDSKAVELWLDKKANILGLMPDEQEQIALKAKPPNGQNHAALY